MMTTAIDCKPRWPWIVLSIAIVALAIISRVGMIAWPFLNDSGLYAELGKTVAQGGVMYRDFYETKLPGAGLLAAAFWLVFGSCWAGYVLCQLALALLASVMLGLMARRYVRPSVSLPTFLFATVFLNLGQLVYTGFQLETIQVFFEVMAAFAAVEVLQVDEDRIAICVAAGVAAGIAAMAKPGGLGVAIAFAFTLLLTRKYKSIGWLIAGIAVPTSLTLLYTVRSGAWPYLPDVLRDIARYGSGTPFQSDAFLKLFVVLMVLAFPFIVRAGRPGFVLLKRSPHSLSLVFRPGRLTGSTSKYRVIIFAMAWFLADLAAAIIQRRLYPYHFLPLCAPAALLYGLLPCAPRILPVTMGLLPLAIFSLTWEGSSPLHLRRGFQPMAVSSYITANTQAGDTVFADQIGRLLIETNRQPGSRLGTFFYFVNSDDAPQQYCQTLLSDFETRKPKFLVLNRNWDRPIPGLANCDILQHAPLRRDHFIAAWATLREYVAAHYVKAAAIDDEFVYRRK